MLTNPYNYNLSIKSNYYLLLFSEKSKDAIVIKRDKESDGSNKYSKTSFSTHKDNPRQMTFHSIDGYTLTLISGEVHGEYKLISLDATFKEFTNQDLATKLGAEICQEWKMLETRTENEILGALNAINSERDSLEAKLAELDKQEDAIFELARKKAAIETGVPFQNLHYGVHMCENGENSYCIYDIVEDPARDDCLKCGMPHERK